jgi:hypothetical protein
MAPMYFNRVKIISLIEMDVSKARVTIELVFPKSWRDLDKTNRIY